MFASEIMDNWAGQPNNYATKITTLCDAGYDAWTLRTAASVGVAIPLEYGEPVCESFASVEMIDRDITLPNGNICRCLLLMAGNDQEKRSFASLCSEFATPGFNGLNRKEVSTNPIAWWLEWKELLGNKNINERVYDVIAELSVLEQIASNGKFAEWNGPSGATYDIDCDDKFIEVKSTTSRNRREITLSNRFQLIPPDGRELKLVLCQLEASSTGRSINGLVKRLVELGFSELDLNTKLARLGLGEGKSARCRCYIMHAMTEYAVDDDFPAIRDTSFVGGKMPKCITGITYTVALDGVEGKTLLPENGGNN